MLKSWFPLLCLIGSLLSAETYYVDNLEGDDGNDGRSPQTALKTLAMATGRLQAGDELHLAAGRVFYESLVFKSSGTPSRPITVYGNGAVISGLAPVPVEQWKSMDDDLYLNANSMYVGARRPRVLDERHDMISVNVKAASELKPGEALWNADGIYYKAKDGISPTARKLFGFYRDSGLVYNGNSYITVENVISENNANDGFNVHGYCRGLIFRNIVGRWNGDDGFSIHEDVQAVVLGAHLHHNDFGIQDICLSRSQFFGVLSEDNRIVGVDLSGGFRSLDDCVVRNNGTAQIRVMSGVADHLGIDRNSHSLNGQAYLRNVLVTGGRGAALAVMGRAQVTAVNCSFLDSEDGVVFDGSELDLQACVVANGTHGELSWNGAGKLLSKGNVFYPGQFTVKGKGYASSEGLALLDDVASVCQQPLFGRQYHAARPMIVVGKRSYVPGFNSNVELDFVPETPETYALANAPMDSAFDFESVNPWSRTYCDSDKQGTVKHASTLTDEQAASGKSSAKIQYVFPPAEKAQAMYCKLFSVPFADLPKPISYWKFKIYSDGSNDSFKTRIRDRSGEYFYGPSGKFDWKGWKTIEWNLAEQPPQPVTGGDGNHRQDAPLELVIDFWVNVPPEGRTFTFYVDDLEFR